MPVVLRLGPYVFRFYAREGTEPPHVHVQRDGPAGAEAKFWIGGPDGRSQGVRLAASHGFSGKEARRIERLVIEHERALLDAWNEFFPH